MKLSFKTILPIILISALLILLAGCFGVPADESPGYTPGTITGIIAAPCCSTSAEPVSETCCVSPEYWCYYCQANWLLQDGIEVVLTYGEDEVATVFTNKDGEFTFTNVDPGKNYVVTAYCPDFADNRPLVKDVALELIEGGSFDTNITDLVSTSLGLVVDFLVLYTEWGPEDISLNDVLADRPDFPNFPKFKALIYEVRRVVENCEVNLLTDDDVLYATCRAAEEISKLEIGCGPGATPPPIPPPDPCAGVPDPTANAGVDQSFWLCPGTDDVLIGLTGSGSGTGALSYSWDLDDDESFGDSAVQNPWVYFGVGIHYVTLKVTDDCGSATDEMIVTITEHAGPTAEAGGPYTGEICPGETTAEITLDGSGSTAGDTPIVSWEWSETTLGPLGSGETLKYDFALGSYTVTLTVTDENGCTDSDDADVEITECINTAPEVGGLPERQAISAVIYQGSCIPTYRFTVSDYASDDGGKNNLAYSLVGDEGVNYPTGMTIDPDSGEIVWNPECISIGSRCHECGLVCVTVKVQDDGCCQPSYTDVKICIEVWNGWIDSGAYVGIGFDGCPIDKDNCPS